jgi:hypothetical protein
MHAGLLAVVVTGCLSWLAAANTSQAYVVQPQVALRKAPDAKAPTRKTLRLNTAVTVLKEKGAWRQVKAQGTVGFLPVESLGPRRLTLDGLLADMEKSPGDAQATLLANALVLAPQRTELWERLLTLQRARGNAHQVDAARQGLWDARARDTSWDDVGGVVADGHALWPLPCAPAGTSSSLAPADTGPLPAWPADAWLLTTEGSLDPQPGPPVCFQGLWAAKVASDAPGLWLPRAMLPDAVDTLVPAADGSAPACGPGYSVCRTFAAREGRVLVQLGARSWTGGGEDEDTHADGLVDGAVRVALRDGKTTRWSSWTPFPRTLQAALPVPVALTQDAPRTWRLALWHAEGPCCQPRPAAWWMLLQQQGGRLKVTTGEVAVGPP